MQCWYELSGFHDRDILYSGLLGCDAVRFGERVPAFRKKIVSPSSGLNVIAVLSVEIYVPTLQTRCHNSEEYSRQFFFISTQMQFICYKIRTVSGELGSGGRK